MLSQNAHPTIVSETIGHSQIGITLDLYFHVILTMQQQAASAMDSLFVPKEATLTHHSSHGVAKLASECKVEGQYCQTRVRQGDG